MSPSTPEIVSIFADIMNDGPSSLSITKQNEVPYMTNEQLSSKVDLSEICNDAFSSIVDIADISNEPLSSTFMDQHGDNCW